MKWSGLCCGSYQMPFCGKESPTEISLTEVEQIEQLAIDDPSQAYLKAMDLPIPEMIFSV